jgi:Arc/MetJ-type ribon-helix-helix transcriptional regulator
MPTIPVELDDVEIRKIDHLVKIGRFKNRSQAIRSIIRDKLVHETYLPEPVDPETEKRYREVMVNLRKLTPLSVQIESMKSPLELIKGERERI